MSSEINLIQILLQSGIVVKLVFLALVFASILSWAIIIQKQKVFKLAEKSNQEFVDFFKNHKNLAEIFESASQYDNSGMGLMFQKGYHELIKIREKLSETGQIDQFVDYFRGNGLAAMERSLKQGVNLANMKLEHRLSILASIGSISPFVGLFGTVWGIINSFTGLAHGGGSIEAVAPGIAEALVATAIGLAAAIPAVMAFNVFNGRLQKINTEMDNFAQDFINLIERSFLIQRT